MRARRERARVAAAEADVQEGALAEDPAVAVEVGAEVELGPLARDGAALLVARRHAAFHLLCRHQRLPGAPRAKGARHRAELPARSHDERRPHGVVDDEDGSL
ncbi:MAG TPA: hypothetical protein VII62_08845, partial [Vicinamibacteria bacterium]